MDHSKAASTAGAWGLRRGWARSLYAFPGLWLKALGVGVWQGAPRRHRALRKEQRWGSGVSQVQWFVPGEGFPAPDTLLPGTDCRSGHSAVRVIPWRPF